jgi:hypothetical protein
VAKTQERTAPQHPDLLAAVVLQTLVSRGTTGLTAAQVARACERDPDDEGEAREVEVALAILLLDDLALREAETYRPTRAAIRAAELSF